MLCYVMLCYVLLPHVISCYVVLCYVMLCYAMFFITSMKCKVTMAQAYLFKRWPVVLQSISAVGSASEHR